MTTVTLPRKPFELGSGSHPNVGKGACFNELAAVLAGEPFSASPACVSPVIEWQGQSWWMHSGHAQTQHSVQVIEPAPKAKRKKGKAKTVPFGFSRALSKSKKRKKAKR